ncbi:transposase [Xylanibacter brevis]|uniref:transposase n=1 Tax=Xylanibacter brevis TaxID=83231 RepID=UPI0004886F71|nr:transposase [Xylanibacter brevis]
MPRQSRKVSGTGIHHVMMRGINHQNILEDPEDYYQFIATLDRMRVRYDYEGSPVGSNCTYYAYCLMSNHFHLLIREREESVGETIKRIASSYVYYYNRKYGRDGHLFKERFKSEPVNDMSYFTTLMRYIHQNPVKAGVVEHVKDYEYSSWGEYDGTVEPVFQICHTQVVLNRIPFTELDAWVNEPLSDDVHCLDIEDASRKRPSDDQVWQMIIEKSGVTNASAFQQLNEEVKRGVLRVLKEQGASHRQLERLTGIGRGIIQKL